VLDSRKLSHEDFYAQLVALLEDPSLLRQMGD
jgi:hypothetical protein